MELLKLYLRLGKGSFHKFVLNEKNVRVMMKAATPKK